MQRNCTDLLLPKEALVPCIEKHLKVLKNTSSNNGLRSEWTVLNLYVNRGHLLAGWRYRNPICEWDLVFIKENEMNIVEVKSWVSPEWGVYKISKSQSRRLGLSLDWAQSNWDSHNVRMHLAFVNPDSGVSFVPDFLAEC